MTQVLDRQIEAYRQERAEGSRGVPDRRSVESLIDLGVSLFEALKNEVRRWQRDVVDWDAPQTIADARGYDHRYRMLHDAHRRLAEGVTASASDGAAPRPENAARLHQALRELDAIVCFDLDRVAAADRAFRSGKATRTMAEVRDGLRRRLGG